MTTPIASRALQDLNNIANLRVQNRADPSGAPSPESIIGINLRGVDQARWRLVSFYKAARGAQNPADARAVSKVIDEFDAQVERAFENGLFSGDEGALNALREARSAYASYQGSFRTRGSGDDAGQAIRKIVERDATPEEIANYLYGQSKVGARGVSERLAARLRSVLGPDSAEWRQFAKGVGSALLASLKAVRPWGRKSRPSASSSL